MLTCSHELTAQTTFDILQGRLNKDTNQFEDHRLFGVLESSGYDNLLDLEAIVLQHMRCISEPNLFETHHILCVLGVTDYCGLFTPAYILEPWTILR